MSRVCESQWTRAGSRRLFERGLRLVVLLALVGIFQAPVAAARDVVRVESVGASAVRSDSVSPRDAAVHKALLDAVHQVAEGLLAVGTDDAFEVDPVEADEMAAGKDSPESGAEERTELQQILGDEPLEYATRFQVVEDRGEGPALFGSDLDVETEYVVIVSVFVDRDRIRERLTRAGMLLTPAGQELQIKSRLILENIGDYWVYAEIRRVLLEELKMRSVTPREFAPGRGIFELNAAQSPREYLGSLQRSLSDQMELVPLSVESDEMILRVEAFERQPLDEETIGGGPIDTRNPNRY